MRDARRYSKSGGQCPGFETGIYFTMYCINNGRAIKGMVVCRTNVYVFFAKILKINLSFRFIVHHISYIIYINTVSKCYIDN